MLKGINYETFSFLLQSASLLFLSPLLSFPSSPLLLHVIYLLFSAGPPPAWDTHGGDCRPPQVPHDWVYRWVHSFQVSHANSQKTCIPCPSGEEGQSVFIPGWVSWAASTCWDQGGQRLHTESTECAVVQSGRSRDHQLHVLPSDVRDVHTQPSLSQAQIQAPTRCKG